jgi:DNA-binding winged helix-turn-helix (wHTH) protein/thioredoxin-like negative regulator of GroEL
MKEGENLNKTECYEVDDLVVNLNERTVYRDNERLTFPELSFDLFAKLIEKSPNPVSRDVLVQEVWHSKFVNEDTIVQRIAMLRKVLNDDPKSPRYIRTVRGIGYALLSKVEARKIDNIVPREKEEFSPTDKIKQFKKVQYLSVGALLLITILVNVLPQLVKPETQSNADQVMQSSDDKLNDQARQLLSVWQADENNKAIELLQSLLARNPTHTEAALTLSFALSTRETKFDGSNEDALSAEKIARSIIEDKPLHGSAWHALAYALDAQSQIDEALLAYQRAYEIDPTDTTAMSSAAHLMLVRGRLYEALQLDLKGRQSLDSSIFAELQIAKSLELLGLESSEFWWQEAEKLPLNDAKFRYERVKSYLAKNQLKQAEQLLKNSLAEYPKSKDFNYLLGRLMLRQKDIDNAKQYFVNSGNQGINDLAATAALGGDNVQAQKQIEKIEQQILLGNTWPATRVTLAELYSAVGKEKESFDALVDAIDLGWRDINVIETSPFLGWISTMPNSKILKARIQQELNAQRELVINLDGLLPIK